MSEGWTPLSEHPEPPKPAKRRVSLVAILIGLGALMFLSCAGVFGFVFSQYINAPEASAEDRAGLLNIDDVQGWTPGASSDDSGITDISVDPWVLGSRAWRYQWTPLSTTRGAAWVASERTDDASLEDARISYSLAELSIRMDLPDDVEATRMGGDVAGINKARYWRLEGPDGPAGNMIVVRRKLTTFAAVFGPKTFDNGDELEAALLPVWARSLAYRPTTDSK